MKSRNLTIALAVAALIPLGAAVAGDQYGSKDKSKMDSSVSFKKLDTNKDGRISQAEAAVDATVVFSSADTNGDGYLDSDEWKASEKGSNQPRSQSQPESTDTSTPSSSAPPPADSTRSPDTEAPRQQ